MLKSPMDTNQRQKLIDAALIMRGRAYAPYSHFHVGAALLTASGRIFDGCNVENASYGLTLCAERVAVVSAVANGETEFVAMAVATSGGASPCGACRQFAAEFRSDLPVLIVDADHPEQIRETNLAELLPEQFRLEQRD
jgi:cytidine deaminase